jgi:hypothetical protein
VPSSEALDLLGTLSLPHPHLYAAVVSPLSRSQAVTRLAASRSPDPSVWGSRGWRLAAMPGDGMTPEPWKAGIRRLRAADPTSADPAPHE